MSQEARTGRGRTLVIVAWVGGAVVSLLLLLALTLGIRTPPPSTRVNGDGDSGENPLAVARSTLAKQTDFGSCRAALYQLNSHLANGPLPAPAEDELASLRRQFSLGGDELEEVKATSFTPLDAHHLETCLLLRDAARGLEQRAPSAARVVAQPPRQTPLEQAAAAFAWVVRCVRLREHQGEPVPPLYVLRRGWGSALERALVFLAVLEQFGQEDESTGGLQGCLLRLTGKENKLWACGVAVGDRPDALYLFDPRLGLPLPGPGGQGIATLAQARAEPGVLGQLEVGDYRYDVTAPQAQSVEALLVCPLSALAPRMKALQDQLLRARQWKDRALPAPVRVKVSEDVPRALGSLRAAVGKGGEVGVWRQGTGLLRRFLPRDEGGTDVVPDPTRDVLTRQQAFQLELVPWEDFPVELRDPRHFGADTLLGRRVRGLFADSFIRAATDPGKPRDLILHGRFSKAAPELVKEREQWRALRERRAAARNLDKEVRAWADRAIEAFAALSRARRARDPEAIRAAEQQTEAVQKDRAPLETLIAGALAGPRGADTTYLLGLCKHEEAERQQMRLDLLAVVVGPWADGADYAKARTSWEAEAEKARAAWVDAQGWWREYGDGYRGRPGVAAARRMRGRAGAMLGETSAAVRTWQDLSGPLTDLEKLANLYQAQRLQASGG